MTHPLASALAASFSLAPIPLARRFPEESRRTLKGSLATAKFTWPCNGRTLSEVLRQRKVDLEAVVSPGTFDKDVRSEPLAVRQDASSHLWVLIRVDGLNRRWKAPHVGKGRVEMCVKVTTGGFRQTGIIDLLCQTVFGHADTSPAGILLSTRVIVRV